MTADWRPRSGPSAGIGFLFDVDNTLIDNDRVKTDLHIEIERHVGADHARHFWELYEAVRTELDYVDYARTLGRFAVDVPHHPGFPAMAAELLMYEYSAAVFSGALDALRHACTMGPVAILSDGDPVFQPAKISRTGALDVIDGPALVYAHKEEHLDEVREFIPADHYVLVDDKLRVLHEVKKRLGSQVTTVHVCQGKYAHLGEHDRYPDADRVIEHIAAFTKFEASDFA